MTSRPVESALPRRSLIEHLFAPVDIASIVFLRIAFGAVMVWEVWRYFQYGWISRYWVDPPYNFGYFGLEWIKPLPAAGMYALFVLLGILAFNILIGFQYRWSAILFFPAFTYTFLLEEARYLNHLYLVGLISFLMIFVPAHRALSVDARRNPALRSQTAPAWSLLLRFQIAVVYVYGGIAKLNADWLAGVPLDDWLAKRAHYPVIGPFLDDRAAAYLFSWGGLLLDLFIVPALLWKPTRAVAFVAMLAFHLLNAWIFRIGIFPWFMIAASLLFFPPDWPRRLFGRKVVLPAGAGRARAAAAPAVHRKRGAVIALLGAWACFQLFFPLRHFLYPGDVNWTEEGHRFSWHMKLRDKESEISFTLTDPVTRVASLVVPGDILPEWQVRTMAGRPDMILQFSHYLRDLEVQSGGRPPEIRAHSLCRLNGRPPQPLINPTVDLARERRSLKPAAWILPLSETLAGGN